MAAHVGLTPALECHEGRSRGWSFFITESLQHLIATGKGEPALGELAGAVTV